VKQLVDQLNPFWQFAKLFFWIHGESRTSVNFDLTKLRRLGCGGQVHWLDVARSCAKIYIKEMRKRDLRLIRLAIGLLFFLIVSFVHFSHTEQGAFSDFRCPACQLQHSVLSAALISFLFLPLLMILPFLEASTGPEYESQFTPTILPRSPPLI
jgi:hypothetical protein